MNPKVFISHATEDKGRFVLDFARKLRAKGVDAWLDRWEMLPGDSLVDKIFEEGIKDAKAVIVVLSSNSVTKAWVREELDAAMVKRVNKGSLLIPVVLDDCEIPACLHSTIWQKISDLDDYDEALQRILGAIFDHREKPALGEVPEYAKASATLVDGYTKTDSLVLKMAAEIGIAENSLYAETEAILAETSKVGVAEESAWESLEVLDQDGLIELGRVLGAPPPFLRLTALGVERYAKAYLPEYEQLKTQVVSCIVNKEMDDASEIATTLGAAVALVEHVFVLLEMNGYVKISEELGGPRQIYDVSPKLKRALA